MKSKVRLAKMRLFTRFPQSLLLDLSIVHALPEWLVHCQGLKRSPVPTPPTLVLERNTSNNLFSLFFQLPAGISQLPARCLH